MNKTGPREVLRRLVPFNLRVEICRLRRMPGWVIERPRVARRRQGPRACPSFGHRLAVHQSPLRRGLCDDEALQRAKEQNVGIAAGRLDRVFVEPHQVFSYHHVVGRPSRARGFKRGLELHDGRLVQGIGGGCCQVSNLLFYLCLHGGMRVVERHRHGLDLFADRARTVPFGCGATVYYNLLDLRFENPLSQTVLLRVRVTGGRLEGELWARRDPGWRVEVYESEHRFFRDTRGWMRENRIRRRIRRTDGTLLTDHEVVHNRARVLYEPDETVREVA